MTTRNELLSDLDSYFARNDLSNNAKAGTWLRIVEARLNRDLRVREMEVTGTILTTASTRTVDLPSNWVSFRSLTIDNSLDRALTPVTPEVNRESALWSQTGRPEEYSVEGSKVYLSPLPSDIYTLDAVYHSRLSALTNDSDTNDVLTNHYDVYLNGLLEQAAKWIQDLELAAFYKQEFTSIIEDVNRQDLLSRVSGGVMRSQGQTARAIV